MYFSSTGIAYLALLVPMALLTLRLSQYWKDKRDVTSRLFMLFGIFICCFIVVRSLSCLFFLDNQDILNYSVFVLFFFQILSAALMGYLMFYLKFPKVSPWIPFTLILLLGSVGMYMGVVGHYNTIVGEWGSLGIEYPSNFRAAFYSSLRTFILSVAFIPLGFIMLQEAARAASKELKKRSMGLAVALLGGMLVGIMDFILIGLFNLEVVYKDVATFILAVILTIVIILTQKSPKQYTKVI